MPTRRSPRPVILPFVRPPAAGGGLIMEKWKTWIVHGHAVQMIGQRWRADAFEGVPAGFEEDPSHPGELITVRLIDCATGREISPASDEQLSLALSSPPSPPSRRRPGRGRSGPRPGA